jgi:drug/metabolite transporter (DMT)-like permease
MTAERRATLWLLVMCVVWGSSFFSMDLGLEAASGVVGKAAAPAAFLFLRFLASLALFPLVFPRAVRDLGGRTVLDGFLLSLPFYAGFLLQVMGLNEESTTPTVSAFLTNLTVVLTPLLGKLFFRERLTGANLLGAGVSLGGVYILTNPGGGGFGRGEVLTAACALAFAVQIQLTNVITKRSPPEGVTLVMFAGVVAFSGATLAAKGVGPGDLARVMAARHGAWTVLYTAAACSVLAITIMNRFQREVPATRAAVLYTLEPVFAALFAAAFVGEAMTFRKILGGAVIVGGNLVCEAFSRRAAPPGDAGGPGRPV